MVDTIKDVILMICSVVVAAVTVHREVRESRKERDQDRPADPE